MPIALDISGQRYGALVALRFHDMLGIKRRWWVRCDCGAEKAVCQSELRSGKTKSCGCLRRQIQISANMTHGYNRARKPAPIYRTWCLMLGRCRNKKLPEFKNYGGRGIKVCDRWHRFENFLADMGEKPGGLTLDRIDNNGDYEPGNCRWATRKQQTRNTRRNLMLTYAGKTMCLADWASELGINRGTLWSRIKMGWSLERAFSK